MDLVCFQGQIKIGLNFFQKPKHHSLSNTYAAFFKGKDVCFHDLRLDLHD